MNPELIGYAAAIVTTAAYIPQTIKVFKEKHTSSLSLFMYVLITAGIGLWFIYGVILGDLPLMLANGISFMMVLGILIMKIKHG